jgi:hypothetical protein
MSTFAKLAFALGMTLASGAHAAPLTGFGDPLTDPMLSGGIQQGFDTVTTGEYAAITLGDVTYTGTDGSFTIGPNYNGSYNTTGGKSVLNNFDYLPHQFRFDFHATVSAFAFNFGASDTDWLLQAFDSVGALIDSLVIAPVLGSNSGDYFGLSSGTTISFALLTALTDDQEEDDDDFVFLDRFTTNGTDVPLPGALLLVLTGIAGLGATHRRTRA